VPNVVIFFYKEDVMMRKQKEQKKNIWVKPNLTVLEIRKTEKVALKNLRASKT
jgi:hypothetical protein